MKTKTFFLSMILMIGLVLFGLVTKGYAASANDEFNPNADFAVHSLAVQADKKILVGVLFSNIGGIGKNRIARLNTDGSIDATFIPNADDAVRTLVEQADGKILAGDSFTSISGTPRNHIARLNTDGTLDIAFNSDASFFNRA
ncbi:delta-60 repeat domain-containing protein [bacterium]|nr:delta-60 repeat domain-containing protein [bacterium]